MTLEQFKQVWAKAAAKIAENEKNYSALDAAAAQLGDSDGACGFAHEGEVIAL